MMKYWEYVIAVLFMSGIANALGFRISALVILAGGTYLGVFMVFKEFGLFILMYRGMIYLAIAMVLFWMLKAAVKGLRSENTPDAIDWGDVATNSLVLGAYIGFYELLMVLFGGASESEFGPFSIMTLIGDSGYIRGLLILFGNGLVIAILITILQEVIMRKAYSVKSASQNK